jgi:hypothetical protein
MTKFKCDDCKFNRGYTSGQDEYPAGVYLSYCTKWHWSSDDTRYEPTPEPVPDPWKDCPDYILDPDI